MLVGLYEEPEKPGNVNDYIKKSMGAPSDTDVDTLMSENEDLKRQLQDLQSRYDNMAKELEAERANK